MENAEQRQPKGAPAPGPGGPLFSVLMVNYNGKALLGECLDSLEAQTFRDFEAIMVDNGSKDGSLEYVRERYPWVTLLPTGANLGFGGGNNYGYPHCRGRFIYFLNNDVRAETDALEKLADAVREHPGFGVFASLLIQYRDRAKVDSAGDTMYTCGKSFTWSHYPVSMFAEPREITSACAGAALFARSVLEKIGLFDADFFLNFEDLDLSFRARHAGERILCVPASRIYHHGSASLGGRTSYLSLYYAERNILLFMLKNYPLPTLLRTLPGIAFIKVWGLLKAVYSGHPMAFLRGNLAFLAMLPSIPAKRKAILGKSVLSDGDFRKLLRRHWLREKIAFLKGRYDIPLRDG